MHTTHTDLNGLAFLIMTLASAVACTISYWAGKQTR
jgi:membrane protein DedA with SNARE-associated domain